MLDVDALGDLLAADPSALDSLPPEVLAWMADESTLYLAENNLRDFVEWAWAILEPSQPLIASWYLEAMCEHLEAVAYGQLRRLLITVPPRHTKSTTVSVCFPAWVWLRWASKRFLFSSHAQDLATRDSVACRRVIEHPLYQSAWGDRYRLTTDQNEKMRFENSSRGLRIALSLTGSATGEGGDIIVGDDPHDIEDRFSPKKIERAVSAWQNVMTSRQNQEKTSALIVVGQRVVSGDLIGTLKDQGEYTHLNLPMEWTPKYHCVTGLKTATQPAGWRDPREGQEGALLNPDRYGPEEIPKLRLRHGPYEYEALYQQNPRPQGGVIFKPDWWRTYDALPDLRTMDEVIASFDMKFKDTKKTSGSYVVGQIWGRWRAMFYLIDQVRGRFSFVETLTATQGLIARYPLVEAKLIEEAASGPNVVEVLSSKIPGLILVPVKGASKEARAHSVVPLYSAGNVWLPSEAVAPWIVEWKSEHEDFPMGKTNDQVDAGSQALTWLWQRMAGVLQIFAAGQSVEEQKKAEEVAASRDLSLEELRRLHPLDGRRIAAREQGLAV